MLLLGMVEDAKENVLGIDGQKKQFDVKNTHTTTDTYDTYR